MGCVEGTSTRKKSVHTTRCKGTAMQRPSDAAFGPKSAELPEKEPSEASCCFCYAMTMDAVSLVIVMFALAGSGSPCHLCIYANDLRQNTAVRL